MAHRSSSKAAAANYNSAVRKSTNDLFDYDNNARFKTIYAQAFKDHMRKLEGANSAGVMSPKAAANGGAPLPQRLSAVMPKQGLTRTSMTGLEMKPPLSAAAQV